MQNALNKIPDSRLALEHFHKLHRALEAIAPHMTEANRKKKPTAEQRMFKKFLQLCDEMSNTAINIHNVNHLAGDFSAAANAVYQQRKTAGK